jgi:trehalose 6-phosphate phosphatase
VVVRRPDGVAMNVNLAPPLPSRDWAFFFDIDGTIVELAPSPSTIRLDDEVHVLLRRLSAASSGALALISGRHVADIDVILPGAALPVASQHGLERRDARGTVTRHTEDHGTIAVARTQLMDVVARHPTLLLEDKGMTLALHYRTAPGLASFAYRAMRAARQRVGPGYAVQRGKCVVELIPTSVNKGSAITAFMAEAPFHGRTAVFIGDDLTDEAGFVEVNRLGGHSVKVGRGTSTARWRLDSVSAVKSWLQRGAAAGWAACTPAGNASPHSVRGVAPQHNR